MRGLVPGARPPPPAQIPVLVFLGLFDWILQPFPFQVASLEFLSAVKERGGGEGPPRKENEDEGCCSRAPQAAWLKP